MKETVKKTSKKRAQLSMELVLAMAAYFTILFLFASFEANLASQTKAKTVFFADRIDAENLCFFADAYALDGLRTASKRFEIDGTRYEAIGNTVRIAGSEQQANATCLARLMTADRLKIEKQVIEVQ